MINVFMMMIKGFFFKVESKDLVFFNILGIIFFFIGIVLIVIIIFLVGWIKFKSLGIFLIIIGIIVLILIILMMI